MKIITFFLIILFEITSLYSQGKMKVSYIPWNIETRIQFNKVEYFWGGSSIPNYLEVNIINNLDNIYEIIKSKKKNTLSSKNYEIRISAIIFKDGKADTLNFLKDGRIVFNNLAFKEYKLLKIMASYLPCNQYEQIIQFIKENEINE